MTNNQLVQQIIQSVDGILKIKTNILTVNYLPEHLKISSFSNGFCQCFLADTPFINYLSLTPLIKKLTHSATKGNHQLDSPEFSRIPIDWFAVATAQEYRFERGFPQINCVVLPKT